MKIKRIISTILTVLMSVLLMLPEYQVLAYEIGTPILDENTVSAYSTIENGQYYLKNKATGTYLTVDGAKATNAQNISVATKKETNAFLFGISGNATNGYYLSSQLNSAYVVNPYSDTPTNGTNITLYKKNSDGTQLFYFEEVSGGYCLRSKYNTKLAITVSDNNVKLASYSGNNSQIWTLEKTVTEGHL